MSTNQRPICPHLAKTIVLLEREHGRIVPTTLDRDKALEAIRVLAGLILSYREPLRVEGGEGDPRRDDVAAMMHMAERIVTLSSADWVVGHQLKNRERS